jgi:hypothetical protein
MTKLSVTVAACTMLLSVGSALANPTPQENCDYARVAAWKTYHSCVERVVAKLAHGAVFDMITAFAQCRHTYFTKWTAFQSKASLATSTCIGSRLTDNGTTVTDNLTDLVWEKKTNDASVHDAGNLYTWSTGSNNEDGTAFTSFLGTLNGGGGFAGANGWRLPTMAELQTILRDFACTDAGGGPTCNCGAPPCIDGTFGATKTDNGYWPATSVVTGPDVEAWGVDFGGGGPYGFDSNGKESDSYVRAVRGGL